MSRTQPVEATAASDVQLAHGPAGQGAPTLPPPDHADVPYGAHPRQVFDFWSAAGAGPRPLYIFIHGGGFRTGSKAKLQPSILEGCLAAGISVAAINYRYSDEAPYPGAMLDAARAVQFLRHHSGAYNVDPTRFAAGGGSAGAGIAQWLAFRADRAEPGSDDPIARESTHLTCVIVTAAQTSYCLNFIKRLIGGRAHLHPAMLQFFRISDESQLDDPAMQAMFDDASPINFVSAAAPPVHLYYETPYLPLTDDLDPVLGMHHPRFGEVLKQRLDELGVECVLRYRTPSGDSPFDREYPQDPYADQVLFLRRHLKP